MNLREAAQQALEALIWTTGSADFGEGGKAREGALNLLFPAIADLRAALTEDAMQRLTDVQQEMDCYGDGNVYRGQRSRDSKTPTPTISKTETVEPVAWISYESLGRLKNGGNSRGAVPVHTIQSHTAKIPLYTAPPKRKPLTDEEIEDLYFDCFSMGELKAFARAIERAHGIGGEE